VAGILHLVERRQEFCNGLKKIILYSKIVFAIDFFTRAKLGKWLIRIILQESGAMHVKVGKEQRKQEKLGR
jgi:hypothetical protein